MLDFIQKHSSAFQTIAGVAGAIVVFVWWFFRRERLPRAKIDIDVEHVELDNDFHLIRVIVTIENIGHVLICVTNLKIFIQQILPTPYIYNKDGEAVPFDFSTDQAGHEINWPSILDRDIEYPDKERPEFEPGESGPLIYEFILDYMPDTINVYVNVRNEAKRTLLRRILQKKDVGWTTSKIYKHMNNPPKIHEFQAVQKQAPQPVAPKPINPALTTKTQQPVKQTPPAAPRPKK